MAITLEDSLIKLVEHELDVSVIFRPFISEFLETVALYFNITLLSTIGKQVAERILAHIDPSNRFVRKKILLKNLQNEVRKVGLEDLFLGRLDRGHSVVVRNDKDSCLRQSAQEVVIKSWDGDNKDRTLLKLIELLKDIAVNRLDNLNEFLNKRKDHEAVKVEDNKEDKSLVD